MGIQVPEGFRGEMAMAGNWQTIRQTSSENQSAQESLSTGIRKRKLEDEEAQDEMLAEPHSKRIWGKTTRRYPGEEDSGLDALLSTKIPLKQETQVIKAEGVKTEVVDYEEDVKATNLSIEVGDEGPQSEGTQFTSSTFEKTASERPREEPARLPSEGGSPVTKVETVDTGNSRHLSDVPEADSAPVFKKRKAKIAR